MNAWTALADGASGRCPRIPALAVTGSGRVICVWDDRPDWRDLPGDIGLVQSHSDDHGRTWSPPVPLRSATPARGCGDASLIWHEPSGRLLCFYTASTGQNFFSSVPGGAGLENWLAVSRDDGATWHHRELTDDLRASTVGGLFASSGNGCALSDGRLLQPFVLRDGRGNHHAAMACSDDGGQTWRLGEWIGPDCDENKVAQCPDGSLLLHARATPRRRWARSHDGGRTFTPPTPHPALTDPACNGGLVQWQGRMVCSLLDDEEQRRRLVLRLSDDQGESWGGAILLDEGAAGYSVLVALADGGLGIAYEQGDYEAICFRRVEPAELGLDGTPVSLVARPGGGVATPPLVAPARHEQGTEA
ncbi:sialidase family protein [Luteococcus sp. OSA5]|uniref:sialidase family protein n=1 Tax=Luteococcus sp. OSA5 TaxID=3401630 RepID=UPI003B42B0EF